MARIMIVDDEKTIRELLRRLLESKGFEVSDAENGKKALELFRRNPVDLVITDILMPVQDGFQTINDLRIEFPDVKIIAMSGGGAHDSTAYLEKAQGYGANRTFAKPFGMLDMLNAVQELL